jgi:colicin import membrane protein
VSAVPASLASASAGLANLRPREADGWGPGIVLALGVHLLLVLALTLGVRWKITNPEPVEAEVWAEIPKAAAPELTPPPPAPQQPPVQAVEVPPRAVPPAEPVKATEPEPPMPEPIPDVVTARAHPKKERKKKHHEPVEVFETAPPKVAKKPERKAEPKVDAKAKVEPKTESKREAKAAPPPKQADAKATPSKATSADSSAQSSAEREAQRRANLARMMNDLGTLGTSSRSGGPSAAYAGRIKARIKPNIVFTDTVNGNPLAVVEVRCGPDGRIISRKLIEPSGVATWDEAVLRAVDRTEVLPADESGRVPPVLQLEFKPKDF